MSSNPDLVELDNEWMDKSGFELNRRMIE